jgi:hypothetical protein
MEHRRGNNEESTTNKRSSGSAVKIKKEERTQAFESLPFHATADINKALTNSSSNLNPCVLYQLFLLLRWCELVSCAAILAARFSEHDCVEASAELWDEGRSRYSTSGIHVVHTSCHNCLACICCARAPTLVRVSVSLRKRQSVCCSLVLAAPRCDLEEHEL